MEGEGGGGEDSLRVRRWRVEGKGGGGEDSLRVRRWRVRGEMGSHCIPARVGEGKRSSCLRYQW